MSGIKRKGLVGYQPTRDKCPLDNCKLENIRGDDIKKHFQSIGNLLALIQANTHQSELRKNFKASNSVAVPNEFLNNCTIYLFQIVIVKL